PAPPVEPARPPEPSLEEQRARQAAQERARAVRAEKQAVERAAAEKAATARIAAEKAAAERDARAAEAKARSIAEAKTRAELELRRRLAEEERVSRAQASGLQDRWVAQIQARIARAWIRPPTAKPGLDCTVQVTQVPGGEVVRARVASCNGDQAVQQSIEAAVLRASPLPEPPDPALFVRDLEVRFRPND
ncbi:MAG: cell envelope integrity protein TolA, partial [Steroidobacteraceae bacterium]